MQITKHKELLERRKQYGLNRGSITSQLKQHQIKPTEFVEYGRDDEFSLNSYHSPTLDNFNGSLQYRRKAKIFDKFVNVVNNKPETEQEFSAMICWLNNEAAKNRAKYTDLIKNSSS